MSGRAFIARSLSYLKPVIKEICPDYPVYLTDSRLRTGQEQGPVSLNHTIAILHEQESDRYKLIDWLWRIIDPICKESKMVTLNT